jgi:hypothetical protein
MLACILTVGILLVSGASTAFAEIEKFAIPGENGMLFHWWPKLPPLSGWAQDRDSSFQYSINALAPVGSSFVNADTVIYAKAVFKPREPKVKSLAMLIENDKKDFLANVPGVTIQEAPSVATADGKKCKSLTYTPKTRGNWERVSYLEEGEFYLIFTVSSRTQAGFLASAQSYEGLITQYKEKP